MKLNLTNAERANVSVTFNVNRFEAYSGDILVGKYFDKAAMKAEFRENEIVGAQFDGIAQRKYLEAR